MQILEIRNLTERHRADSIERIVNGNHHGQSSRRSKPMQRSEAEQRSVTGVQTILSTPQ
jgi:hypothetical protein